MLGCALVATHRSGPRLTVSEKLYHPDCFVCKQCRKPFPTHQFLIKDGDAYHPNCLPVETVVTATCAKCHHDIGCVGQYDERWSMS